jgi:hypothetical protein
MTSLEAPAFPFMAVAHEASDNSEMGLSNLLLVLVLTASVMRWYSFCTCSNVAATVELWFRALGAI